MLATGSRERSLRQPLRSHVRLFVPTSTRCWIRGNERSLFLSEAQQVGKKLYVGNLPYSVTDSRLEEIFAAYGTVTSAQVIMDRDTGRSKGFGFVEMSNDAEAQAAIDALNLASIDGRNLTVNEARPKTEGGGGGGGGRGGRGGYGGGGGGGRGRY